MALHTSTGHHTHLQDITHIYRTLHTSTGHYTHLQDTTHIYMTLHTSTGHHTYLQDITHICRTLHTSAGHYTHLQDTTHIYRSLHTSTRHYTSTGHYTHLQDITEKNKTLPQVRTLHFLHVITHRTSSASTGHTNMLLRVHLGQLTIGDTFGRFSTPCCISITNEQGFPYQLETKITGVDDATARKVSTMTK